MKLTSFAPTLTAPSFALDGPTFRRNTADVVFVPAMYQKPGKTYLRNVTVVPENDSAAAQEDAHRAAREFADRVARQGRS